MASAPQQPQLPLFYNDLMPLNSQDHRNYRTRGVDKAPWLAKTHALPITVDEFVQVQRHYPIVFSVGDNPLPLALMGLNEGVNTFVDDEGKMSEPVYLPAYVRRYPFMLARLKPEGDELSLCFDPTSEAIGEFSEGEVLFDEGGQTTEATKRILEFCQHFEQAAQRTQAFLEEIKKADLLMDGEVSIQQDGQEQPFVYRGFRMINQEKLQELAPAKLEEWSKNGLLPLIHAQMFSLDLMRTIFARQVHQGRGPQGQQSGTLN